MINSNGGKNRPKSLRIKVSLHLAWVVLCTGCLKNSSFQSWQPTENANTSSLKAERTIVNGIEADKDCELAAGDELLMILTLASGKPFTAAEKDVLRSMPCIDVSFRATDDDGKMDEVLRGIAAFECFLDEKTVEFTADFVTPKRKGNLLIEVLRNQVVPERKGEAVSFKFDKGETETITRLNLTLQ